MKRKQKEACDCRDCVELTPAPIPEAPTAVPQESLACVLFLCSSSVTRTVGRDMLALDRLVQLGSCGLLSLNATPDGEGRAAHQTQDTMVHQTLV